MTITEIAAKSGVSIGTVDRVIHKRGRVAPATERKINAVIAKYGYEPNLIARHLKLHKSYTVGVLLPLLSSEFGYWALCLDGIKQAQKELSHFNIKLAIEEFDRTIKGDFLKKGKKLLCSGIDALLLPPVVQEECKLLLAECENGIEIKSDKCAPKCADKNGDENKQMRTVPYAFFDSPLPSTNPLVTVAQVPFKGGTVAGRIMSMLASCKDGLITEYATVVNSFAHNSLERSRGFCNYFANDKMVKVHQIDCLPSASMAQNDSAAKNASTLQNAERALNCALDNFFAEHANVQGLFVVNDSVHLVAKYLVHNNLKNGVALIGYDDIRENKDALLQNHIDCIIAQRPQYQAYAALCALYKRAVLNKESETIDIPVDIFFRENI